MNRPYPYSQQRHLARRSLAQATKFAAWWLWLWGAVAIGLIVAVFFTPLPFHWWAVAVIVCFGTMETIGIWVSGPYPPLTDVIRAFLPYWAALLGIWALMGAAGSTWNVFSGHHPIHLTAWFGLLGWFTAHFTAKYLSISSFTSYK